MLAATRRALRVRAALRAAADRLRCKRVRALTLRRLLRALRLPAPCRRLRQPLRAAARWLALWPRQAFLRCARRRRCVRRRVVVFLAARARRVRQPLRAPALVPRLRLWARRRRTFMVFLVLLAFPALEARRVFFAAFLAFLAARSSAQRAFSQARVLGDMDLIRERLCASVIFLWRLDRVLRWILRVVFERIRSAFTFRAKVFF